ncbi:hypothetical protein [Acinetobacter sp. ANC 5414]|uniref:hypothetical protein n=1 Tax=Acinetobacter sp. ANC 5414 TaxID=2731251 RepID=UPI00148FF932|nr:hypothetical protein [Acinetobacter sp. ANC 5414]NNG99800.1 hypothetical protein [Acinetobacter sp. ANC 5414]
MALALLIEISIVKVKRCPLFGLNITDYFSGNTGDACRGIVISEGKIVEAVPLGQAPIKAFDESFDAQICWF